jgi:hypothetical protein
MSFVPPDHLYYILVGTPYNINDWNSVSYIEELMNLDDRKYLSENLQNCLKAIDIKFIPNIIGFHHNYKERFNLLVNLYKLEQKKVYDEVFIEKAKVQIEEQKNEIASLKEEIGDVKKIIETLLTTLELKDNPHKNNGVIVPKYQCC